SADGSTTSTPRCGIVSWRQTRVAESSMHSRTKPSTLTRPASALRFEALRDSPVLGLLSLTLSRGSAPRRREVRHPEGRSTSSFSQAQEGGALLVVPSRTPLSRSRRRRSGRQRRVVLDRYACRVRQARRLTRRRSRRWPRAELP